MWNCGKLPVGSLVGCESVSKYLAYTAGREIMIANAGELAMVTKESPQSYLKLAIATRLETFSPGHLRPHTLFYFRGVWKDGFT